MTDHAIASESKTELLDRMRSGRDEWGALLAQIPDAAREEPVLAGVEELPPDPEGWDLDRQNAVIHARYKDKDLAEVVDFADRVFAGLTAAVEGVRAEDFARPDAQSWTGGAPLLKIVPGQCYAHYQQHMDELRSIAEREID